jgi:hypothetical protein
VTLRNDINACCSDFCDPPSSVCTRIDSAGWLADAQNSTIGAITDDASSTTYTAPSAMSKVTQLSSMSSYGTNANELLELDHSPIASKFPSSSTPSDASVQQSSPSDPESLQHNHSDDGPNTAHRGNESKQNALGGEGPEHCREPWIACEEYGTLCDEKSTCATRGIICVRNTGGQLSRDPSFILPSTDFPGGLSHELDMLIPDARHMDHDLESLQSTICVRPKSGAKCRVPVFESARLGGRPTIKESSCELSSNFTQETPQTTHGLGIAQRAQVYAVDRWLRQRGLDPWSPVRATGNWSSRPISNGPPSCGLVESRQMQMRRNPVACNLSRAIAAPPPDSLTPSEHSSVVALFEGLSLRLASEVKNSSIQIVGFAGGAEESPTAPAGSHQRPDSSKKARGKQKVNGCDQNGEKDGDTSGGRDDPNDRPRKRNPAGFKGYFLCIYWYEALDIECCKAWRNIDSLKTVGRCRGLHGCFCPLLQPRMHSADTETASHSTAWEDDSRLRDRRCEDPFRQMDKAL